MATVDEPIVVGAGPVGLVAALALARHGVATTVLEAGPPDVAPEWRGSTLHPPTVEILDRLGVAAPATSGGIRVDRVEYRDLEIDTVVTFPIDLVRDRTRFPFRLQYEQYKLLGELRSAADASPLIAVRYGVSVTEVHPGVGDEPARVWLDDGRSMDAPWVIAADGSHSAVRRSLGISMEGATYPTLSLVVATTAPLDEIVAGLGPVSYWAGPFGRVSIIRTPDTWRIAMSTDDPSGGSAAGSAELRGAGLHPRFAQSMALLTGGAGARRWGPDDLGQHQVYRSHQRVASTFGVGRAVLIGDAAHLSATTGGMGLNSGVHDAYDLASRLGPALASGGDATSAVAESVAARQRVAREVVQPLTTANRRSGDAQELPPRRTRLDRLAATAADHQSATAFVAAACMLDALDL